MKLKRYLVLLMLVIFTFGIVGCGGQNVTDKNAGEQGKADIKGTTIKVIATDQYDDLFAAFKADTGVTVEYLDMSSGEAIARIKAEGGKPMADVWFGGGADAFIAAKDEGLLEAYISPEAETIDPMYKDKDGYWTGWNLVITGLLVNKDVMQEKGLATPTKWSDLAKPEYKDEVLMSNPAISGTNYAIVNGLLQAKGEEEGWKLFKGIGQNAPYFSKRGKEPSQKTIAGEVGIGITYIDGTIMKLVDEYPVEVVYPEDGIPWVPACMAIFSNNSNVEGSKAFVDWILSKKGQEFIRDANGSIMVRPDVAMPEVLKDVPSERYLKIDVSAFGEQRDQILAKWAEEIDK